MEVVIKVVINKLTCEGILCSVVSKNVVDFPLGSELADKAAFTTSSNVELSSTLSIVMPSMFCKSRKVQYM